MPNSPASDAEGFQPLDLEQPGFLLRRAQQIAVAIFLEEVGAADLTPVQYAALAAIASNDALDATRLAAIAAFDRSTVGSVVDRLEDKGLIVRRPSPDDRRQKLLAITAAGMDLLRAATPGVAQAQARILQPLEEAEREAFLALLRKLVEHNNHHSRAPLKRQTG